MFTAPEVVLMLRTHAADHIVELHKVSGVVHYNVLLFSAGEYDLKLFLHSKLNVDEID